MGARSSGRCQCRPRGGELASTQVAFWRKDALPFFPAVFFLQTPLLSDTVHPVMWPLNLRCPSQIYAYCILNQNLLLSYAKYTPVVYKHPGLWCSVMTAENFLRHCIKTLRIVDIISSFDVPFNDLHIVATLKADDL